MKTIIHALILAACLSACDLVTTPVLTVPGEYQGANFEALAEEERAVISLLDELSTVLSEAQNPDQSFTVEQLTGHFLDGNPSLSSYTNSPFRPSVDQWLIEAAAASGDTFDVLQAPLGNGGVSEGYLLNGQGQDVAELVLKGLHTALLYYNAVRLTYAQTDTTLADRLLAIYGAHPDLPASYDDGKHSHPDSYLAAMAAARDDNSGSGFYSIIQESLIQLQAASAFPVLYAYEIDEARQNIRYTLELVLASTIIHELQQAIHLLDQVSPPRADLSEAIHRISSATGISAGFRMLPSGYRLISDVQIDGILEELLSEPGQISTIYELVQDPVKGIDKLEDVIDSLQFIYGFSDSELIAFKSDWVARQSR